MADYNCYPVWEVFNDGGVDELKTDDLPISQELKRDLTAWEEQYQSTYDPDYPPDSSFSSKEEEEKFIERGKKLWKRLRQELGEQYLLEPYER